MAEPAKGPDYLKSQQISPAKSIKESPLATQMNSQGPRLKNRISLKQSKFWQAVPLIRASDTYFARRTVRIEYVAEIRTHFSQDAELFDTILQPTLLNTHLESISNFDAFTSLKPGRTYFTSAYATVEKRSQVKIIKHNVDRAIKLLNTQETEVQRLFTAYSRAEEVFQALPQETEYHVLNTFMKDVETKETTRIDRFESFLNEAKPLKKPLAQKTPQEREAVLKFALTKQGHQHIMQALQTHSSNPILLMATIDNLLRTD